MNNWHQKTVKLKSVLQTGSEMLRLATDYNTDVAHFDSYSIPLFYDYVKNLRYKADPNNIEYLSRPSASLRQKGVKYRDCDDKAILIGAFLFRRKIPFRFVGVSTKSDKTLHHVIVEANIAGKNRIVDATYPRNYLFMQQKYTAYQPLTPWVTYG